MKGLYFNPMHYPTKSGVEKKIFSQINAFQKLGITMDYLTMDKTKTGDYHFKLNEEEIRKIKQGKLSKILNLFTLYNQIYELIKNNDYDFIYFRYNYGMNPSLYRFLKALQKKGIKILTEIPTYPYDAESKTTIGSRIDAFLREKAAKLYYRIITFSENKAIWNIPTINISNGIDLANIPIRNASHSSNRFIMLTVAQLAVWHGVDRIIEGMAKYYEEGGNKILDLYVISGVSNQEEVRLKKLTKALHLESHVHFEGAKYDEELNEYFNISDLAIGSLGRHRNNIYQLKTLKNAEYAARGIPFVYSENNSDFDHQPYIMKVPADDSPININDLISFTKNLTESPELIRKSVTSLDWIDQIKKIVDLGLHK